MGTWPGDSTPDENSNSTKSLSDRFIGLATIIALLAGGWRASVDLVQENFVEPVCGINDDYSRPTHTPAKGTTLPSMCCKSFEVFNPGPGRYNDAALVVLVPNEFVSETLPPKGLDVHPLKNSDVKYKQVWANAQTYIVVSPSPARVSLNAGQRFGIRCISSDPGWTPVRHATATIDGNDYLLDKPFPEMRGNKVGGLLRLTPYALILLLVGIIYWTWRWRIPVLKAQATKVGQADAEARGMNRSEQIKTEVQPAMPDEAIQTLRNVNPPEND